MKIMINKGEKERERMFTRKLNLMSSMNVEISIDWFFENWIKDILRFKSKVILTIIKTMKISINNILHLKNYSQEINRFKDWSFDYFGRKVSNLRLFVRKNMVGKL